MWVCGAKLFVCRCFEKIVPQSVFFTAPKSCTGQIRGELEYEEGFVYLVSDASRYAQQSLGGSWLTCGRYLIEIGRYTTAAHVLNAGFNHCKNENCLEFTNLCVNKGQCRLRTWAGYLSTNIQRHRSPRV